MFQEQEEQEDFDDETSIIHQETKWELIKREDGEDDNLIEQLEELTGTVDDQPPPAAAAEVPFPAISPDYEQTDFTVEQLMEVSVQDDSLLVSREGIFLDRLARLIRGPSTCSAVCYFEGQFHVTFNELQKSSKDNKIKQCSEAVFAFMQRVANREEITTDDRIELLKLMCTTSTIGAMTKGNIPISKSVYDDALNYIREILDKQMRRQEALLRSVDHKDPKPNSNNNALAYICLLRHMVLIRKVEKCIEKSLDMQQEEKDPSNFTGISCEMLESLKRYEGHRVLQEQSVEKVHAEVQLACYMLRKGMEGEYYFGISYTCCLCCRGFLNMVKKTTNLTINVRGAHNKVFKWQPSDELKPGYEQNEVAEKDRDHFYELACATKNEQNRLILASEELKRLVKAKKASHTLLEGGMFASSSPRGEGDAFSHSGMSSCGEQEERLFCQEQVENTILIMKSGFLSPVVSSEVFIRLKIAAELVKLSAFHQLCQSCVGMEHKELKTNIKKRYIERITTQLMKKCGLDKFIAGQFTMQILSCPELVGDKVARHFPMVKQEVEQVQTRQPIIHSGAASEDSDPSDHAANDDKGAASVESSPPKRRRPFK